MWCEFKAQPQAKHLLVYIEETEPAIMHLSLSSPTPTPGSPHTLTRGLASKPCPTPGAFGGGSLLSQELVFIGKSNPL